MVTQNYTISTVKTATPPKVKMSQYDYGMRTITFAVVDGSGAAVDLTGKAVTVEGTRIDGHAFATTCTVADNEATFVDTVDMTNAAGDHPAELVVRQNDERLGTMNFIISVEPAAMDEDAEVTEEDKSLFEQLYGVGDAALSAAETLYQHILDNASAPIIYNTASGAVASFSDGANDYPLKGLTVAVEPVQEGSGDPSPSNVRPISGFSEVKVTRCGKNLLPTNGDYGNYTITDAGAYTKGTNRIASDYIACLPSVAYVASGVVNGSPAGTRFSFCGFSFYDKDKNFISRGILNSGNGPLIVTSPSNAGYLRYFEQITSSSATLPLTPEAFGTFQRQVELGSTATDYEPYSGETYTISLGETVYGGTLDVIGGKMVVDSIVLKISDVSVNRYTSGTYPIFIFRCNNRKYGTNASGVIGICSHYAFLGNSTLSYIIENIGDKQFGFQSTADWVAIRDDDYQDAESFKSAMGDCQIWFKLIESAWIEIPLTPTQINTLLGVNNVYSDAGSVEVEYPADTKQFILNAIASALA